MVTDTAVAVPAPAAPNEETPPTCPPALVVSHLAAAYGQSRIINDLSFSAQPGETVAIMGRNGMGKTTLMKSIMGIVMPVGGSIRVGDTDVTRLESYRRVRAGLGFVPQGRQIFPSLTVEENIRTGMDTLPRRTPIDERLYTMFPVLKDMRNRKGGNLSGGQQQQLAIARALVSRPRVLLLDEPTEGIQPSIIKDLARQLNEIRQTWNVTIIVSEQVLSFALAIADRILVIESGNLVREDRRSEVDEATVARYLSV